MRLMEETGNEWFLAPLHALRGDVSCGPRSASAQAAYMQAIAISQARGARTYHLLAALPLARLLQSAKRPREAHAVLSVALEGFVSTPELAAIAEAQGLARIARAISAK